MPAYDLLLRPLGGAITMLARNDRLTLAAVTATDLGIRTESVGRRICRLDRFGERRRLAELASAPGRHGKTGGRPLSVHWHEGGRGEPLVLVNGLGASGLLWPSGLVNRLEESFRVIRIDNRGTGWSRRVAAPFTIGDLADDVGEVLDLCGIEQASILGFSMGGLVAQDFAIRYPERVARLFLVSTIPPAPENVPAPDYSRVLRLMLGGGPGELVSASADVRGRQMLRFASPSFKPACPLVQEVGEQILQRPTPPWQLIAQTRAIASWHRADRLAHLRVPTTVIQGADDPIVIAANGRRLTKLIPEATYTELAGVGHTVPWEAPQQLLTMVEGL